MEELFDELFQRWVRAFDEIALLVEYRDQVRTTRYAPLFRYNIKDYTPNKFTSGGRLTDEPVESPTEPMAYGLDATGRPVHVAFKHEYNKIDWKDITVMRKTGWNISSSALR